MAESSAPTDTDRPNVPQTVVSHGVTPFYLQRSPVRGRLVRLGQLAHDLLARHHAHPVVTRLAGEALALTAALASTMKFHGTFSLQAKGDGPINMLLADCTDDGSLRGYAQADTEKLAALLAKHPNASTQRLLGAGYMAFTVDQGADMERYQGVVGIEGSNLADMALHYFESSEQLRCAVKLVCAETPAGWRAGALVLQQVAGEGGIGEELDRDARDDAWRTALALAGTLTDAELLDDALPPEQLLYRLFHEEGVKADASRPLSYGCRCSRARLATVLEGFSEDDLDHMAIDGTIQMRCEFCNIDFPFPRANVHSQKSHQHHD